MDPKIKEGDIIAFTDGSCIGNGKANSVAGCGVYYPNKELPDVSVPFTIKPITNQRAELWAIYLALSQITTKIPIYDKIYIYTDSQYSIKCITVWLKSWKKNGWKSKNGQPVKNQDIISMIDAIMEQNKKKIVFTHIRSHTGNEDYNSIGNQVADLLATKGTQESIRLNAINGRQNNNRNGMNSGKPQQNKQNIATSKKLELGNKQSSKGKSGSIFIDTGFEESSINVFRQKNIDTRRDVANEVNKKTSGINIFIDTGSTESD